MVMANTGSSFPLSEEQHSDIDSIPTAVVGIDRSFALTTMNRYAEKLLGSRRQLLGKQVEVVGSVFPFLPDMLRHSLKTGRQAERVEEVPPHCWLVITRPYPRTRKKSAGALAVLHNIGFYHSWFKQRLFREKIEVLGRITEQTAHEIRNPLTAIKGFLQLYRTSPESIPWNLLHEQIAAIEHFLSQLLNLSSRCSAPSEKFNLNDIVCGALNTLAEHITHNRIWPVLTLSPEVGNTTGNPDKIKTLILHLCQNALDAMPNGGILSIATEKRTRALALIVADTGRGISRENLDRIFDPFFSTYPDKAGLGLTVCRQILESCGGSISVSSREGVGTEVVVTIPRK